MSDDNVIFIGNKPVTAYVYACVTQFNKGTKTVILKARGRTINRAVDVAEVLRNQFMMDMVEVSTIEIGTEQIDTHEGQANISSIEITIKVK